MKHSNCNSTKVLPTEPTTITVPNAPNPPIVAKIFLPFYYASISSFWIYFEVKPEVLRPFLRGTGLKPAIFDGKGLVNLNFQNYTGHNGNGLAATNELEFNIVAYPRNREKDIPHFSADCFMRGEDQTKIYGNYRLHVPCDNKFAVAAGKALYGENKYVTTFDYTVPSLNLPTAKTWQYTISDATADAKGVKKDIITVDANFGRMHPGIANPAAIIDYSTLNKRLIGSRRNLFSTVQHYFPFNATNRRGIKVTIGSSTFCNIAPDMAAILGKNRRGRITAKPVAIQVIQTPPVIAESRAYYV